MTDLVMRKRAGHAGEIGLFVESPVFEDDFAAVKMGAEVQVKATTPRSLRQLKFAWALATKIADACDWVETKEDCMDFMLIEAKHFRRIYDPLRQVAILKPKPTNFASMDGTAYTALLKRIVWVATNIMVPGMDDTALKAEIEAMIGPDVAASAPREAAAPKRRRAPAAPKDIPAHANEAADPNPVPQQPDTDRKEEQAAGEGGDGTHANPGNAKPAPTTEPEYIAAARSWISRQTDYQTAIAYLDDTPQIELRAACKLSVGSNKMIRRELAEHCERIKKGETDVKG